MLGTTPERIERKLTLGILRVDYPAGSRLPTVRELAAKFRVNQATIQRVIARLETRGLINARQGSGLAVNDPHETGDLGLIPLWIDASLDDPPRAARLLAGVLEVRRVIAVRLLVQHRERLLARMVELGSEAAAVAQAAKDSDALRIADIAFARKLLVLMDADIALAIFNTIVKVLDEVPLVADAMYAEPQTNAASMAAVMMALQSGAADCGERIEEAMAKVDRQTVARFERLVKKRKR